MGYALFAMAFVGVWSGVLAQVGKGHTGAVWFLISVAVHFFVHTVFIGTVSSNPHLVVGTGLTIDQFAAVCSGGVMLVLMTVLVATLPNRLKKESTPSA